MNPDDKTYTVELSAWEISQLVHCHTRTIKKISNAAGKAVTQERVKLLPSSKEMGLIIDAAQNHVAKHVARAKQLLKIINP